MTLLATTTVSMYLAVGAVMFVTGVVCMATKRNALGVLMGIELVLNGANINFIAFGSEYLRPDSLGLDGQLIALFVIVLAAGEAAVAALALRLDELSGGDHAGGGRAVERDRAEQRDADDGGESAVAFGVGLVGGRADGRSKRTGEKSASVSAKWRGEQQL